MNKIDGKSQPLSKCELQLQAEIPSNFVDDSEDDDGKISNEIVVCLNFFVC